MKKNSLRYIELLAPARDAATAMAAIDHGADAVYMGSPAFGARAQAGNSLADVEAVARYAHRFGARLYVTVNTILYNDELKRAQELVWDLWRAGVDAIIVQDLALTRLSLPPIALHASTQCDIRTPQKARFLEQCGFTRLVLARELTVDEIRAIRQTVSADLEVFVHGALCVSYSGDCQASYAITGRSANRGECCQVCRFKFDLEDADGNKLVRGKHLLSLRDMNRLGHLEELLDAGVCSLKIEGRLKDAAYVKNVTGAYRRELDRIIAAHPDRYRRASSGFSSLTFDPDPAQGFNRGFTDYFFRQPQPAAGTLATFKSPKWIGTPVATVLRKAGNALIVKADAPLSNGDGLGYYSPSGEFVGFRLNRVEGNRIYPLGDANPLPGTRLYRNSDKLRNDLLAGRTAQRKIPVDVVLEKRNDQLSLTLTDADGHFATAAEQTEWPQARTPQLERRRKELEKLGDTIFSAADIDDRCGDSFIPASTLSRLRREAVTLLEMAREAARQTEKPGKPSAEIALPEGHVLSRHDNIANDIAAGFYASLTGTTADRIPRAIELTGEDSAAETERKEYGAKGIHSKEQGTRVMQTRYCLRREMGCCLKTAAGKSLPSPLYLQSNAHRFRLDFDCARCSMLLIHLPHKS